MELDQANVYWYWFSAGILLIALEAFIPGAVLLWFGVAALITGFISLGTDLSLDAQMIIFSVLAVSCTVVFKIYQKRNPPSPEDDAASQLNHPGQHLVGRTLQLATAIQDGVGRVKVADSTWRCTGPDLPQGSVVRVLAVNGTTLQVDATD